MCASQQQLPDPALLRLLRLGGRLINGSKVYLFLERVGEDEPVFFGEQGRVDSFSVMGQVLAEVSADRVAADEFPPALQEWARGEDVCLRAGIRVREGGNLAGLLIIADSRSDQFSPADWELLEELGGQVSVLLERNRLASEGARKSSEEEQARAFPGEPGNLPPVTGQLLELFCKISPTGVIQSINSSAEELLGYTPGTLSGRPLMELIHPDEHLRVWETLQEENRADGFKMEVRWQHHDGRYIDFDCRGAAVRDEESMRDVFLITGRNISRRKRAEAEVLRFETLFQLVWKNSRDAMRLIDCNGVVVEVNDAYCRLVEKTREEVIGSPFVVAYNYPHPEVKLREFRERFAERLIPSRLSLLVPLWTGPQRVFELSSSFFQVENETLLLTIYRDITERRRREAELRSLNDALQRRAAHLGALTLQLTRVEQAERRRLAQAVHDHLQQLLVAARMTMERVRSKISDEETAETAAEVEDLLLESIEASRSITVELSPPILHDGGLVAAVKWLQRRMQEKHRLNLILKADPEAEPTSEAVRIFLFQAVRELVFNCFKHAKVEEVTVTIERTDRNRVCVVVEDGGAGFDWETVRSGPGSNDCFGLFSLGERIDHLGGNMKVDTSPGGGTRVTLVVSMDPEIAVPASHDPVLLHHPGGGLEDGRSNNPSGMFPGRIRLLLVDDHKIMRQGLRELLEEQQDMLVVGEAENGLEGITLAQQLEPDVVVMDLAMPVMNGIEATRVLAAELSKIKVIGLSMHMKEDMAKAMLDAGASAYVTKATASESLCKTIRECVSAAKGEVSRIG